MENTSEKIKKLYTDLLEAWDAQDARSFVELFSEKGHVVGFDGSQMNGKREIEAELTSIFGRHQTGRFVPKIREARLLNPETALLRAIAGMIPPGKQEIDPEITGVQTLITMRYGNEWKIEVFQNTPLALHERPEIRASINQEIRELV